MGQYFVIANTTKKEYLHPHRFGEGLKFMEFTMDSAGILHGFAHLMAQSSEGVHVDCEAVTGRWIGDHVLIVGDYDNSEIFDEAYKSYNDISEMVINHIAEDRYVREILSNRTRWDGDHKKPVYQTAEEIEHA